MSQDQSQLKKLLQSIAHIIEPNNVDAEITVDSRCPENDTPLHQFVWRNELENVQLLLRNGADVNAIGDMGETPLQVAISQENIDIIETLLKSGACLDIRSEFGTTALEEAKELGGEIYNLIKKYRLLRNKFG